MKYEQTKEILNQLVADLSQFSVVIHQTHWYMRGPEFLTLHPLMDEFMDEINEQMPLYKRVKRLTIRKTEFEKTTTRKIKRFANGNLEEEKDHVIE